MKQRRTSTKKEVRSQVHELRVVRDADGKPSLSGYAIVYNSRSVDLGGFVEQVDPAALTRTLRDQPDVYALYAHQSPAVIGRTKSRTLTLESDDHGLRFTIDPPDTAVARDMCTLIERGDIDGCSFGFMTRKDQWEERADGSFLRTLLDIDLDEISITPFQAYPATSVSLRSAPREMRAKLAHRDDDDSDLCDCPCDPCQAGDCDNCDCDGCEAENCGATDCACSGHRSRRDYTGDTQKVDGIDLTKDCFAYTPDDVPSHWKFPIHFPGNEEKTKTHIQNALARFDQADIPSPAKAAVWEKIVAAAKAHGITVSEDDDRAIADDSMRMQLQLARARGGC